jgi:hypothetical protein
MDPLVESKSKDGGLGAGSAGERAAGQRDERRARSQ